MFVYNIKLNNKNIVKVSLIIIGIIITFFFIFSVYKIASETFKVKDKLVAPDVQTLTPENYTNILKSVHDNPSEYLGKKICFTGYVHRLNDFKDTDFVLARDMIISSKMETLIVGFLCTSNKSKEFENGAWVEITGTIAKGDYHGDIPIIKVTDIKKTDKPKDIYVYPPDDSYVPTSVVF